MNLLTSCTDPSLVELFPQGTLLPDFWRLASGVPGLTYRYVSAYGGPKHPTRAGAIVRDIDVDLSTLRDTLNEVGAHR